MVNKTEATKFLKDLMVKIKESDDKEFDSSPTLFFIQNNKKVTAADGRGEDCEYVCEKDHELHFSSEEDLEDFLSNEYENESEYTRDDFEEISIQTVEYTEQLAFLTRESCQSHIDKYRYHYQKHTHTYSRGVWRDPLMEGLFKALHTLYGENE